MEKVNIFENLLLRLSSRADKCGEEDENFLVECTEVTQALIELVKRSG